MALLDFFRKGGMIRNTIIILFALIVFAVITFLLIQSGYAIIVGIGVILLSILLGALLLWQHFKKVAYLDLVHEAYLKLYRATMLASLPYESPLIIKLHENATIQSYAGMVQGRTLLPLDESIDLIKEMGEDEIIERKTYDQDNKTEVIEEKNMIWVLRVKQPRFFGGKEVLCLIADSQISELSRDATGDIQIGTPILAYGHWLQVGSFYVLWNKSKQLENAIKGVKTVAMGVALEKYINRLAQITRMDVKTRQEILERKEVKKYEADAVESE